MSTAPHPSPCSAGSSGRDGAGGSSPPAQDCFPCQLQACTGSADNNQMERKVRKLGRLDKPEYPHLDPVRVQAVEVGDGRIRSGFGATGRVEADCRGSSALTHVGRERHLKDALATSG